MLHGRLPLALVVSKCMCCVLVVLVLLAIHHWSPQSVGPCRSPPFPKPALCQSDIRCHFYGFGYVSVQGGLKSLQCFRVFVFQMSGNEFATHILMVVRCFAG